MPGKIEREKVVLALRELEGWIMADGKDALCKTFRFTDFSAAWAFMARTALLAEKMDHHPEWFNVYNRIDVTLNTHDAGGITEKDMAMARAMNEFYGGV